MEVQAAVEVAAAVRAEEEVVVVAEVAPVVVEVVPVVVEVVPAAEVEVFPGEVAAVVRNAVVQKMRVVVLRAAAVLER